MHQDVLMARKRRKIKGFFFRRLFEIQTSVKSPPPQPISSNWKPCKGLRELFIFDDDDDWRICSRINGIRSWFNECNGAYSPVSFHHEDDNWRKRLSSSGSTELCVDTWRDDNAISLRNNRNIE